MSVRPEVIARHQSFALFTGGAGTPESRATFIRTARERWGRIMKELGIQPQL